MRQYPSDLCFERYSFLVYASSLVAKMGIPPVNNEDTVVAQAEAHDGDKGHPGQLLARSLMKMVCW